MLGQRKIYEFGGIEPNPRCPNAKVLSGLAIRGGSVDRADPEVSSWLKKLDLIH